MLDFHRSIVTRFVLLYSLIILQGCSVGMAMSGKPDPNIGTLEIGQKRDIVLLNLGQPTKTFAKEGRRTDVFHLDAAINPLWAEQRATPRWMS